MYSIFHDEDPRIFPRTPSSSLRQPCGPDERDDTGDLESLKRKKMGVPSLSSRFPPFQFLKYTLLCLIISVGDKTPT